jgi:hypothetical protein
LDEVVLDEPGNAQTVRIGQLVQLTVHVKPAQKARRGRNLASEEITVTAKPARGGCPCAPAGAGEGGAAIDAEGASSTGRLRSWASLRVG